jgi:hypothetical protein
VETELAVDLSRHGRYAAYFWNVNAVMRSVFAEAGVVRRDFDPLLYDSDGEPERALPEERGLPFPSGGPLIARKGILGVDLDLDGRRDQSVVAARRTAANLPGESRATFDSAGGRIAGRQRSNSSGSRSSRLVDFPDLLGRH